MKRVWLHRPLVSSLSLHLKIYFLFTALLFLSLYTFILPASAFEATIIGQSGNVTVMEVSGNYDALNPDGSVNAVPRQELAKTFFKNHKDEYDFLTIFTNFDFKMPKEHAQGFYTGVKNDVQGIGVEVFDNTEKYGSHGKLQGTIDAGNISQYTIDPENPHFEESVFILTHEVMHRWGAHVQFKDAEGNRRNSLLGRDGNHWSFLLDTSSVLYGNRWKDNGDGTFTSISGPPTLSPLDLYLMGFLDKSGVPPMLLLACPCLIKVKRKKHLVCVVLGVLTLYNCAIQPATEILCPSIQN